MHATLQHLYLGGENLFTDVGNQLSLAFKIGIAAFAEIAIGFTSLQTLALGDLNLSDQGFVSLCVALQELHSLEYLNLHHNMISDESFPCLPALLAAGSLKRLRTLHIGENPLVQSTQLLLQQLEGNDHLIALSLSGLSMQMPAIESLASCLSSCRIETLNLSNTGCTDSAATVLWKVLKRCKLTSLYLQNNHLTDQSIMELIDIIENHPVHLSHIGLFQNPIEDSVLIQDLQEMLKQHLLISQLPNKSLVQKDTQQENSDQDQDEERPTNIPKVEQEDDEQDEEMQLAELDQDFKTTTEFESKVSLKVAEQEELEEAPEEQEIEIDANQGKLKVLKWVGEEKNPFDHTVLHSILE